MGSNASGVEAGRIKERKPTFRDGIRIDVDGGEAHVTKGLAGIRGRFHIEVAGDDLKAHGNDVGGPVMGRALGNGEIDVALLSRRIRRSTAKGWSSWSTTGGLSRPRT